MIFLSQKWQNIRIINFKMHTRDKEKYEHHTYIHTHIYYDSGYKDKHIINKYRSTNIKR